MSSKNCCEVIKGLKQILTGKNFKMQLIYFVNSEPKNIDSST